MPVATSEFSLSLSLSQHVESMWILQTTFITPAGTAPVALDLGSMGKGNAWVNGHHLGRFWPSMLAPQSGCSTCDYRGAYNSDKCRTGCGEPSQRWQVVIFFLLPINFIINLEVLQSITNTYDN